MQRQIRDISDHSSNNFEFIELSIQIFAFLVTNVKGVELSVEPRNVSSRLHLSIGHI